MNKKIVLIDDDEEDIEIMVQALRSLDPLLTCSTFLYPEEALRVLLGKDLAEVPSHIFIDINMPGISGDKCLKKLRSVRAYDDVIITLYSTAMPDTVADALKTSGADFVFEKPVRVQAYTEILRTIIG